MRVPRQIKPGFWLVFCREVTWLRRRPLLLATSTLLPLFLIGMLSTVFNAGLATRLPMAVLDQDHTDLSRTIIRTVDATPDSAVSMRVADLSEGRHLILSGKVYGLLMLPQHLERDVLAGRRPEVVFFYNTQMMTSGSLLLRGINNAMPAITSALKISMRTGHGTNIESSVAAVLPIPVQVHGLFNPALDYSHFLLTALIPCVLQVVIVTTSAYALAIDLNVSHRQSTLHELGGSLWLALAGKMLPYTLIFLALLALSDLILFQHFGLPLRGSGVVLLCAGTFFIIACQLMGYVFALVIPGTGPAIGIGTLITAPAFGFLGIGFPNFAMGWFAYIFGSLLPATWYLDARVDQTIRGAEFVFTERPLAVLAIFCICAGAQTAILLVKRRPKDQAAPTPGLQTTEARIPA